jgi:hypothetical protein
MPDTPRESYSHIASTACERCVFGRGEHAPHCILSRYDHEDCAVYRTAQRIIEELRNPR